MRSVTLCTGNGVQERMIYWTAIHLLSEVVKVGYSNCISAKPCDSQRSLMVKWLRRASHDIVCS